MNLLQNSHYSWNTIDRVYSSLEETFEFTTAHLQKNTNNHNRPGET